ncbi:MAG: citramalate synthase [Holophagales bacterium]|nr:citramalate synthase [Holophagales bacterium]MXX61489.1 citramalate synthase [Holophagales bacterium]MYC09817.1 citramalate synthase [Holophagales bacterium]MYD23283.1 citramalate synthase [Holophagales bacterium]MYI33069.1 citramalate synthase [Holophagales bacterium]
MTTRIELYDTTLRDGTQRENISLSLADKLAIARRLDAFGIPYLECGWPGSNPKDADFFAAIREVELEQAKICAFGSTRRKNDTCAHDGNIQALVAAGTPVVTIFGKSWDLHIEKVLETEIAENEAMVRDSVGYLKELGREVIYDAEHFFDGFAANPECALGTLRAAASAGADYVVLCDTNGGSLPWQIEAGVEAVRAELGDQARIGIHTHDDGGCGVANSLAAVRAGAVMVQGTINGYGERVANANLVTILPDLQCKMGCSCVPDERLRDLTALSRYIAEVANIAHDDHLPYVGRSAFAHKGGVHVAAMLKEPASYQHLEPERVGNEMRAVVSELSGRGNIAHLAAGAGITKTPHAREVLYKVKELENRGYSFEAAEASVELMLRRAEPGYEAPFRLIDFLTVVEHRDGRGLVAEATVKVEVPDGTIAHTASEGNGPVNALAHALRKALEPHYPALGDMRLADYKVRILDSAQGTAATTRVLVDFVAGGERWTTVGAGTNIIEASWEALADAIEFGLTS